ncbi:hypothetical protein FEM48_Zijuj07G0052600 [Ziziphus jujuba var. spinosa]|uniref:Uncharacterized protein n=1 Tax=Ziziphus jujuba var. spinosa TaxID=714518 RepID=A0A978V2N9_ZIZJJ|nr:hypothetical protein FEM48_Zijuj07G0052600 [Ziziphus jujuba var. spinosa]
MQFSSTLASDKKKSRIVKKNFRYRVSNPDLASPVKQTGSCRTPALKTSCALTCFENSKVGGSLPFEFTFIPEKYPETETEGMDNQHHHRNHTNSVTTFSFISDWDDEPFTDEDLQAIEAALQSASKRPQPSSSHNHDDNDDHNSGGADPPTDGGGGRRRRLPSSIVSFTLPRWVFLPIFVFFFRFD